MRSERTEEERRLCKAALEQWLDRYAHPMHQTLMPQKDKLIYLLCAEVVDLREQLAKLEETVEHLSAKVYGRDPMEE